MCFIAIGGRRKIVSLISADRICARDSCCPTRTGSSLLWLFAQQLDIYHPTASNKQDLKISERIHPRQSKQNMLMNEYCCQNI